MLQAIRAEHEIVPKIERWRELSTLAKTYLDVLPEVVDERSRIHTTFLQAGAQTGRLASTNPNMQNVPIRTPLGREIRGCFEAEDGQRADLRRLLADRAARARPRRRRAGAEGDLRARRGRAHGDRLAGLPGRRPRQIDPGMRSKSKMINYGIVYGLSDFGLADRLNIPREEAKEFIDAYLERFPRVAAFIAETIEQAKRAGLRDDAVGPAPPDPRAAGAQLPGAHARRAARRQHRRSRARPRTSSSSRWSAATPRSPSPGCSTRLLLTIHDELLFEGPPQESDDARALIEREMCGVWDRDPPLAVDVGVGRTWLEAK